MLVAHGDPQGGYILYIENGRIVFGYNQYGVYSYVDAGSVPPGSREITLTAAAAPKLRWDFAVAVDGRSLGELVGRVQLVGMSPWTGISVGLDARGPVSWGLRRRRGVFRYTGNLRSVTYIPGPVGVPAEQIDRIETAVEAFAD